MACRSAALSPGKQSGGISLASNSARLHAHLACPTFVEVTPVGLRPENCKFLSNSTSRIVAVDCRGGLSALVFIDPFAEPFSLFRHCSVDQMGNETVRVHSKRHGGSESINTGIAISTLSGSAHRLRGTQ